MTLWHKKNNGEFSRIVFEHTVTSEIKGQEIKGSQRTERSSVRARLFTVRECNIQAGDKLILGYSASNAPPDNAYIISSLKKNFDVSPALRHYRADCV
ncbi:MAG: hypothetical protein IJD30_03375 [Clostridia bacterium]|nr:hypothetical protein [Clostridia bacterium]